MVFVTGWLLPYSCSVNDFFLYIFYLILVEIIKSELGFQSFCILLKSSYNLTNYWFRNFLQSRLSLWPVVLLELAWDRNVWESFQACASGFFCLNLLITCLYIESDILRIDLNRKNMPIFKYFLNVEKLSVCDIFSVWRVWEPNSVYQR